MDILPLDNAKVLYCGNYLTTEQCEEYYDIFSRDFDLTRRKITYIGSDGEDVKGKLNRGTCVFGDPGLIIPDIWGDDQILQKWTPEILTIKEMLETTTGFKYNICLVNYYSGKSKSIGWHSDREELGDTQSIASISIGSARNFVFRRKGEQDVCYEISLANGSLLWMGPGTQENYEHSLPYMKSKCTGRINLTFRLFHSENYKKTYAT